MLAAHAGPRPDVATARGEGTPFTEKDAVATAALSGNPATGESGRPAARRSAAASPEIGDTP
ncbi:hypothetical protein [Microbacterium sp. Clip185]|uniref:hypothetical protein n=1 Tax=Microbacterium sp. Clip185 TaxID=3025663 RepID=UPI0023658500|nr:hypothetical protein [Microbacterium sp. Clip185]WDG17332.1 hypothetical protein PQV94_11955 [Microbacterium sp. Clip185]